MGINVCKILNIPESMNDVNAKSSSKLQFQHVMCIVSSLSGAKLEYQTKTEGVQCGKRKYFWANQLLTPSSTHSSCEYEQLWAYCIHLNSICSPVEWSAVGPRLGWGSVESGARSAKRKPAPTGPL